jgi:molybdate transport system permease protein
MLVFVALFILVWTSLIVADVAYVDADAVRHVAAAKEIRAAVWLSLWTTVLATLIGLVFSVPVGYALSRLPFRGRLFVDALVDLPILLPPLIVGLSLLVFFQTAAGKFIEENWLEFTFQKSGIVLCQVLVSTSFGIRAMTLTYDGIDPRLEHVAQTLGYTRFGAFLWVAFPLSLRGVVAAGILVWTRAFGIFGPLMVFVGAVRMRTEVLPTTIYLEQSVGRIEVALAVAILMLILATVALVGIRLMGRFVR